LSAAGIKIREGKHAAAVRHTGRATALLRRLMKVPDRAFECALGMSPAALAEYAEAASRIPAALQATAPGQPQPVFNFFRIKLSREAERIAKEKQSSVGGATKWTAAIISRTSGAEWSFADLPDRSLSKRRQSGLQGYPSPVSPVHCEPICATRSPPWLLFVWRAVGAVKVSARIILSRVRSETARRRRVFSPPDPSSA
jgi:hypothetical protein